MSLKIVPFVAHILFSKVIFVRTAFMHIQSSIICWCCKKLKTTHCIEMMQAQSWVSLKNTADSSSWGLFASKENPSAYGLFILLLFWLLAVGWYMTCPCMAAEQQIQQMWALKGVLQAYQADSCHFWRVESEPAKLQKANKYPSFLERQTWFSRFYGCFQSERSLHPLDKVLKLQEYLKLKDGQISEIS